MKRLIIKLKEKINEHFYIHKGEEDGVVCYNVKLFNYLWLVSIVNLKMTYAD